MRSGVLVINGFWGGSDRGMRGGGKGGGGFLLGELGMIRVV